MNNNKTTHLFTSWLLASFVFLAILVSTIIPAYAAPTQDMMVTDNGEMLTEQDEQEISEMLYSINRQTGIEYLVYTIKSLNGEDIETCANRLFRTAGLGDKEKTTGCSCSSPTMTASFALRLAMGWREIFPTHKLPTSSIR